MATILELLGEGQPAAAEAPIAETPGQFKQGLRSGFLGAGSQLNAAAGGVAEAMGFNDFAQGRFKTMRELAGEAQAAAPRVTSYETVLNSPDLPTGIRNAFDYTTGLIGQSVPVTGAAVLGGLATGGAGLIPAMAGAAGATLPFNFGEVVQRQQADPESMKADSGSRMRDAFLGGGAASLVEGVVPAIVGGKLAGRAAVSAAKKPVGQILGEGVLNTGAEGVSEGAGEVAKQLAHQATSPGTKMDWEAVKENVVGGAAAGGALASVGVAGDLAHKAVQGGKAAVPGAKPAQEPPKPEAEGVEDTRDTVQRLKDSGEDLAGKAKDFMSRVAAGEDVADLGAIRGKTAEAIAPMMAALDGERAQRMKAAADELLSDAGLTLERRAEIAQHAANITDRASQAAIAGFTLAKQATADFSAKAKALYETFKKRPVDAASRDVTNALAAPKRSDMSDGLRQAIAEHVLPALPADALQGLNKEGQNAAINQVADSIRSLMEYGSRKGASSAITEEQMRALTDMFGDKTVDVLQGVHDAIASQEDPEAVNQFFGTLNRISEMQKADAGLTDTLRKNLLEPDNFTDDQIKGDAEALRRHFGQTPDASPERAKLLETRMRAELDKRYGKNTDTVLAAVEKDLKASAKANPLERLNADVEADLRDPNTKLSERTAATSMETISYGRFNAEDNTHDGLVPASTLSDPKSQAAQALTRAKAEHPTKNVEFLTADQLPEDHPGVKKFVADTIDTFADANPDALPEQINAHLKAEMKKFGLVVAEGTRQETSVSKRELKGMMLKKEEGDTPRSWYNNPARLDANGTILDGIKMTEMMNRRFADDYTAADNKSRPHRAARMFMEAVAAAQEATGKTFEIPDSTVITKGGLTWGEVKGLDFTPPNEAGVKLEAQIAELRKEYAAIKEAMKAGAEYGPALDQIVQEVSDLRDAMIAREQYEQTTTEDGLGVHGRDYSAENTKALKDLRKRVKALETELNSPVRDNPAFLAKGREILGAMEKRLARLEQNDQRSIGGQKDTLQQERDPFGAVGQALQGKDKTDATIRTESSGNPRGSEVTPAQRLRNSQIAQLREKFTNFAEKGASAGAKSIGERGLALLRVVNNMPDHDHKRLVKLLTGAKASEAGQTVSSLTEKYAKQIAAAETADSYNGKPEAAPEVAAKGPKGESEAYASTLKSSLQGTTQTGTHTAQDRADVRAYVDKVLGPSIKTVFKRIFHAGEFEEHGPDGIIRISVHALNPMSVAYHESLHAFFAKLLGQGNSAVTRTLMQAAMSAPIQNQLKRLLQGEPAALAQLADPEESAAYMYQFWAAGQLTVGSHTKTFFERVADALRQVLGIWSNDRRALEIMEYFQRGDFKANMNNPSAVTRALVEAGRNQAVETAKGFTRPLRELSDALMTVGGERLRDTGVPALRELADAMKLHGGKAGEDPGFLPAARSEATRVRNDLMRKLTAGQHTQAQMQEALEAMQLGVQAASPEAQAIQMIVQGPGGLLPRMLDYMRAKGVDVTGLKIDHKYFPRVWNTSFIAGHQAEFLNMLERYKLAGQMQGEPRAVLDKLMAADGNEFTVETDKPGMQALKKRVLDFVSDADAAPFMRKDMLEILNGYITQATRRGEWAERFGDQGERIAALVTKAKKQGATPADIDTAHDYVRAVDGTLGDSHWMSSPKIRHLMGNMMVYQNIRLLPLAVFSSVVDPLGIVVRGGTVAEAFGAYKSVGKTIVESFRKENPANPHAELAKLIGTIDDEALVHTLGAAYTQGMVGDTGRKINDTLFKWNLMEAVNRGTRISATHAALAFMARHADGTASPHSERWMAELGYKPGEYDPNVLDAKAKAAVNRWTDGAVLRPDAADAPIWTSDPRFMLVAHLKRFTFSFNETILKRVAYEYEHGNYAPSMALASYVPVMIAADMIKGMIQGGGETPQWKKGWTVGDYIGSGVERAGLLGVGQFAVDTAQMGPMGALGGPTLGQLWDGVRVAGGSKQGDAFVLKAMPANALYGGLAKDASGPGTGPKGT